MLCSVMKDMENGNENIVIILDPQRLGQGIFDISSWVVHQLSDFRGKSLTDKSVYFTLKYDWHSSGTS